jgi:hypothetical protein
MNWTHYAASKKKESNEKRKRNNIGSNRKTIGLLNREKSWNGTGPIPQGYVR